VQIKLTTQVGLGVVVYPEFAVPLLWMNEEFLSVFNGAKFFPD